MITHRESTVPNRLPRYAHPSSPGVRTSSLHEPTASPEREVPRAHAFHASAGRAVVSVQSSVKTSLKVSYKPVSDPGHGPAGSARDPPAHAPTDAGRRPRSTDKPSTCQPQVQEKILGELLHRLQSEQLNDFSDRGQRREAESGERPGGSHEPRRGSPGLTQPVPAVNLVPAAQRAPDEGGAWEHYGPPPRPPHWSAVSLGSEARGQEIRAHSERMSNVPLSAVHAG